MIVKNQVAEFISFIICYISYSSVSSVIICMQFQESNLERTVHFKLKK